MERSEMRRLVDAAPVGELATVGADGRPHVVPVCFVLVGDTIYSAVDHKPKSTQRLRRIRNLLETGHAAVLVHHYEADWSRLWWVRMDGVGRVVEGDAEVSRVLAGLGGKYPQYVDHPPRGPVLAVDITVWTSWPSAAS
ncbi:MAG: TIGR03668 family PPOX class F420-dependent oxidoreductase [Nocardioidaceae bacterium]